MPRPCKPENMTRGDRVIAFVETYLKVPEGEHVGHPIRLEEFQKRFIREIYDIWTYRANLSDTVKREISPPYGNPFMLNLMNPQMLNSFPIDSLKLFILDIMEQLVKEGINRDSRYLGANYILCALTLVSPEAAEALPWLYQSVAHTFS